MTDEEFRLAEALAIQRRFGRWGPAWVAERVATFALTGDEAGQQRFTRIASAYEQLLRSGSH